MRVHSYAWLLTLLALSPAADAASKTKVPALLERARYVALGYDLGDGFLSADQMARVSAGTLTDERRAIESIRTDLEKWGRYIVTDRPEQADILIAVRVGRRAAMEVRSGTGDPGAISRGEGGNTRSVSNRTIGAQLSSNDDRVDVYEAVNGRPGIRLWSAAAVGGLAGSPPSLYRSFREEIGEAPAAAKKP